jgi:hypothetical protein
VGATTGVRRHALLWLVLFAAFAATAGLRAAPAEDLSPPEAHNLLAAESIVSDGDVDLADEYGSRAWRAFYGGELVPVAGPRAGRQLEPTGVGFPALIAPAYALGGRLAVELFLAAVSALGFVFGAALGRRLVPDPWATGGALAAGLSPPALIASTTIAPDAVAGTVIAGAAVMALSLRERPRVREAFAGAGLVGLLPWLALKLVAPGAVVALALWRWLRRRNRALAGFTALEVVLFSLVLFVTVNDRLYGGLTPYAVLGPGESATGAHGLGAHLARWPRLAGLWLDPAAGIVVWAPFSAMAFVAVGLLVRSRRQRLAVALPGRVDVEVAAGFLVAICTAGVVVAAFLAPALGGPWFAGHELACVLPCGGALAAWGTRRFPRSGIALGVLTVAISVWLVATVRLDAGAGVAPPHVPPF